MFSIQGNAPPQYDAKAAQIDRQSLTTPAEKLGQTANPDTTERRLIPDRRQRQVPWNQPDRRRKKRRSPLLLNPKTAAPEPLDPVKGRLLDTRV